MLSSVRNRTEQPIIPNQVLIKLKAPPLPMVSSSIIGGFLRSSGSQKEIRKNKERKKEPNEMNW